MTKAPVDLKSYTHTTAEFIVRPYEVTCPRCTGQPWERCLVLSRCSARASFPHPARVAAAQRTTRYHVYEMSKGRLVRTFADVPNAEKFARDEAQRTDVEDIDAGTLIAFGTGPAPATIRDHADIPRAGLVLLQTFHRRES